MDDDRDPSTTEGVEPGIEPGIEHGIEHSMEPGIDRQAGRVGELFAAALAVQRNAHAPYSHYRVGAAVLTPTGRIYSGCNVENAAYPEGWCAEASAIAAMVAAGERQIVAVLTVCDGEQLGTCCGGCRQRIREFAKPGTPIFAADGTGVRATFTLDQLLPYSFGPEHLG